MKKKLMHFLGSGMTYGAVIGMLLFLMNTPAEANLILTLKTLLAAAITAAVAGLILALAFWCWDWYRARRFSEFRGTLGDTVKLEDSAARLLSGKKVRGRLFLTEDALYFKVSGEDKEKELTLAVDSVVSVEVTDPRRCHVTLTLPEDGSETFAVTDPLEWFSALGKN